MNKDATVRDKLNQTNKLNDEIKRLESFLRTAEKVWTGKIIKRTSTFIIKSNPYGAFDEAEYKLDTKTKNKMLDVLRENLADMKNQLKKIMEG
ncbi:hypothetical protein QYF50_18800 [Paenibacillus vini]|uniref:hypothetical protein n=1 Tax=Paenibacillus vini TaxID=1476024 RepID=UPI0025B72676|nr:hypothetical protein [Paenibacillus vini]MDN4069955.1 hypothetical protein [Paenibacillus vini]